MVEEVEKMKETYEGVVYINHHVHLQQEGEDIWFEDVFLKYEGEKVRVTIELLNE